ncbi:MAG TPA: flagellar motor switch protein FliN [Candidatus Butyricicoccus avistercoris]|uniref:Flagellar motor switch protein FliN n=1 Tax=Candidatus Butyricicoccus avistercoris TaxID=2838518 RepID=A0A9D1PH82_9FIRM|nr:flagellar motor switch protein FliN [Candidatus Butyricicoccus avistercoris]
MGSNIFSPMAIDAIGEIFNISLGSSATAVSNMLARRVDITTPTVTVVAANDFCIDDIKPAIGVKIDYVAGLNGSNVMLLKRSDVRAIVDILMGMETKDEDFEINELNLSAISEVMNQMMGAASTAMSDFLGEMVNISTPEAFEIENVNELVGTYFPSEGTLVVVRFQLTVEDAVESEFMSALSVDLVREMLKGFGIGGADVGLEDEQASAAEQVEAQIQTEQAPQIAEQPAVQQQPQMQQPVQPQTTVIEQQPAPQQSQMQQPMQQQPQMQQQAMQQPPMMPQPDMQQQYAAYPPYPYPPMYYMPPQQAMQQPEPKTIKTSAPAMPKLEQSHNLNEEQAGNLDLLMSVPVDISVEIGRTRRRVKDILNYTKGSLVVLDRLAGDRADLYVNGKCIAKGDIVVVDDSFGLRIAEIVEPLSLEDL